MNQIYKLYDFYEGKELISITESKEEATLKAKEHSEDCDGECFLFLYCNGVLVDDWEY